MEYLDALNSKEPVIEKVVAFGSVITDKCTNDSDIDLCFFSDYDTHNLTYREIYAGMESAMDDLCDILSYKRLNDAFVQVVDNGVIVYEK